MDSIKLLVVDDERLFAEFLSDYFNSIDDFEIVGVLHDGTNVIESVKTRNPDIVLLDLNMPKQNGFVTIKELKSVSAIVKIVILSSFIDSDTLKNLSNSGIDGILTKNSPKAEIEKCIRIVYSDGFYYSRELMKYLTDNSDNKESPKIFKLVLSKREIEVLTLIANQHTSSEISEIIKISARTVETHRRNMLQKLNLKNTAGLIKAASEMNLVNSKDIKEN